MGDPQLEHLTPAETELWAEGLLPAARALHLSVCEPCRVVAERDRKLFLELSRVEQFAPRAGFAERVLEQVKIETTVEGGNGR